MASENYIPEIDGILIDKKFFYYYMRNIFGESFAHSSLSFERMFVESTEYQEKLNDFMSADNLAYAKKLENGNENDKQLLLTRRNEIISYLIYRGVSNKTIDELQEELGQDESRVICIEDFVPYIDGAVRPYRNRQEINAAIQSGKTISNLENESLIERIELLLQILPNLYIKTEEAKRLKYNNNMAFIFAINSGTFSKMSVQQTEEDIKTINSIINSGDGLRKGYRIIDNGINDCTFETCSKQYVAQKMTELVYKYNHEWAAEIPTLKSNATRDDKEARTRAICEREAKFHIEFERIHPFEDGNGRTGRIIINKNLIHNGLAPIYITPAMRETYLSAINNYDYKKLGDLIFILSDVTLTNLISEYRQFKQVEPDEIDLQNKNLKK